MILALLLLVQGPAPADTLPHWRGELGLGVDHHTRDRTDWSQERAALGRRWGTTTVQADLWNARRFGISDQGGGIELYLRPAPRLGIYLRGDAAPGAEVLPRGGVTVSATSGVGRGWEGTLHYRHMAYRADGFDLYGGGFGRYRGRWYLRMDATLVPHAGATGSILGVAARRYGRSGDPDDFIEARIDGGKEVVLLGAGTPPTLRRTLAVAVWGQHELGRGWGVRGSVGWTDEKEVPARSSLGVALLRRW